MAKVLVWYEPATVGVLYTWIDRFVSYHKHELRLVDKVGQFLPRRPNRVPVAYKTLYEALEDMADHVWVFVDPKAEHVLDEFPHPEGDKVVYAFGSDRTGFDMDIFSIAAARVRLRNQDEIYVMHALPYVLYDRYLYLLGRRR